MEYIAWENSALSLLVTRQPEAYFHISLISSISTTDHKMNDKKPAILIPDAVVKLTRDISKTTAVSQCLASCLPRQHFWASQTEQGIISLFKHFKSNVSGHHMHVWTFWLHLNKCCHNTWLKYQCWIDITTKKKKTTIVKVIE